MRPKTGTLEVQVRAVGGSESRTLLKTIRDRAAPISVLVSFARFEGVRGEPDQTAVPRSETTLTCRERTATDLESVGQPWRVRISYPQLAVTQVRAPAQSDSCGLSLSTTLGTLATPNTCRNQRRGLSTVSVFAVQQPIECGQLGCLQDGCSALSLHMRTAERAVVIAAVSQAAPWRAPSAEASANVNERRGDRVHKLGSGRPKAGPLNVLGSDATLIPDP
jgi:hypothetical protein